MTDRATLCRVFNEAYEKEMRGPTASTALGDALMAVRAETLREVRGVVEGMPQAVVKFGGLQSAMDNPKWGRNGMHEVVSRADTLAALDALAHPEAK